MKKIIGFVKDFGNSISESNASAFAASAAFFMFLSLVPVIMLFCSIIPYTHIRVDNVTGAFSEFVPIYIEDFISCRWNLGSINGCKSLLGWLLFCFS